MKLPKRILSRRGFIASGILAGLAAPFAKPERVEAIQGMLPPVIVTDLQIPSTGAANFTTTYTKIGDIGSFTVHNPSSLVEVTHQGLLFIDTIGGTYGAYFELRVDDLSPTEPHSGRAFVFYVDTKKYLSMTFSGYWQGLTVADHTVSLWVKNGLGGSGTGAWMGRYGGDSHHAIVKEYLPFGATYLPLIQK